MTGTESAVLLERHEGWAEIVLNRPDRRNAIDGALADGLLEALAAVQADATLRAVVLRGAGATTPLCRPLGHRHATLHVAVSCKTCF